VWLFVPELRRIFLDLCEIRNLTIGSDESLSCLRSQADGTAQSEERSGVVEARSREKNGDGGRDGCEVCAG
jgi:hypothetical protein